MDILSKPRIQPAQLAQRLKVTRKTIYKWMRNGTLPEMHRIGTIKFWTEDQIKEWENENVVAAKKEAQKFKGVINNA